MQNFVNPVFGGTLMHTVATPFVFFFHYNYEIARTTWKLCWGVGFNPHRVIFLINETCIYFCFHSIKFKNEPKGDFFFITNHTLFYLSLLQPVLIFFSEGRTEYSMKSQSRLRTL